MESEQVIPSTLDPWDPSFDAVQPFSAKAMRSCEPRFHTLMLQSVEPQNQSHQDEKSASRSQTRSVVTATGHPLAPPLWLTMEPTLKRLLQQEQLAPTRSDRQHRERNMITVTSISSMPHPSERQ